VPSPKASPLHTEIYTPAQIQKILAHTAALSDVRGRQRHVIVSTLRHTGMRSGELRTLRHDGLDLTAGTATVYGKGARQRLVLLPPALLPILGAFLNEVRPNLPDSPLLLANAHPFVTTAQHGFGTDALAREVELAGLGAGVPGRHYPHKWRHTFATELVRAGVDIHVVQRLLGHRHIASTVGYTHLALDDLRTAVGDLWGAA
jgi:site-specific recombinase XerD